MASRLEKLPIRTRILLLVLGVMLPLAALFAAMLANDVRRAEVAAGEKLGILATGTAADLQRTLDEFESVLARVSARPLVKALDAARCDPLVEEFLHLNPAIAGFAILDMRGKGICEYALATVPPSASYDTAVAAPGHPVGRLRASGMFVDERTGRKLATLSYAVRDGSGVERGLLAMTIDLPTLNAQLLASVPKNVLVTILDQKSLVVLRSQDLERYIGKQPVAPGAAPARLARSDSFSTMGRDGVQRIYTYVSLRDIDWRVVASLPEAEVFAEYRGALWRFGAFAIGFCLLAFGLAWRMSRAIIGPIAHLQETAGQIAAGKDAVRASVAGPPEIKAVAEQFNRMLDAGALSDARLRGVLESVVDAVLTTDEQHVIVQANPAAAEMLGCALPDLIGAPLARFIPARYQQIYQQDIRQPGVRRLAPHRMGRRRDVTAVRTDGVEFPVEASISNMSVAGQSLFTVILRDITERRLTEQALRDVASKLEAALSSMSDAVCIADGEGRLIEFNLAFANFHGFEDKAACDTTLTSNAGLLDMLMPDGSAVEAAQWPLARALQGETASNCEYRLRRKDSGKTWIGSYSFGPIRAATGAIVGAVVTSRDVTATKDVQADLESSHYALQRLIASRDQVQEEERMRIARELHDDLQQTLAAMRMNLRFIGDEFGAVEPRLLAPIDVVDRLAEQAVASTRRIVNDLRPPMLEDLGVLPALELLASQFVEQTGIACKVEAPASISYALTEVPEVAICLYRIVQEALNNVVKHAHARSVRIVLAMESPAVMSLQVTDDGLGMDPVDRHKPDSFGILGIKERVRAHGGFVRIDSTPGAGTRLEVQVSLASEPLIAARQIKTARSGERPQEGTGQEGLDDAHTLPRLLSRTAQRALQDAIDALVGNVAILDARGVIRFVNRAWTEFARRNGNADPAAVGPGVDYLAIIRQEAIADGSLSHVARGLDNLLHGSRAAFSCTYACHSPGELRWFQMNATPMANGDAMVEHVLIRHERRGRGTASKA